MQAKTDAPTLCPYCLKSPRYVPLAVHEANCPARRWGGVEPHDPQTVARAADLFRLVGAAGQRKAGRP